MTEQLLVFSSFRGYLLKSRDFQFSVGGVVGFISGYNKAVVGKFQRIWIPEGYNFRTVCREMAMPA